MHAELSPRTHHRCCCTSNPTVTPLIPLLQVKYGVEDREAPYLSEEVDKFVAQHFPGRELAANGANGVHFGASLA